MFTPSASLAAHQKSSSRKPSLALSLSPNRLNSPILSWQRIYRGPEPDQPHAATLTADGRLIILRNNSGSIESTPRYLYPSTTQSPSGTWAVRDTLAVATATPAIISRANGEVLILYAKNNDLKAIASADHGATWGAPATIITEASALTHVTASFRSGSADLAVFYGLSGAPTNLRRLRRTAGVWDAASSNWTNGASISALYELAATHDGSDYILTLSGLTAATNHPTHWAVLCGDLGFPGIWSALTVIDQADAASTITHRGASIATTDGRLIATWAVRETAAVTSVTAREASTPSFTTAAWSDPAPFEPSSLSGPSYALSPTLAFAVTASGVWVAPIPQPVTLTARLTAARLHQTPTTLTATLTLDDAPGTFAALGITTGWTATLAPGYASGAGGTHESGITFALTLEAITHRHKKGTREVILTCTGPLEQLARWRAASAWQAPAGTLNRFQLLTRAAQKAAVTVTTGPAPDDPSPDFTAYSPSFAWAPGEDGTTILSRLLNPLNDGIRTETGALTIVNRTSRQWGHVMRRLAPTAWYRFTTHDFTAAQDHSATQAYAATMYNLFTLNPSGGPLQGGQPSTYITHPNTGASFGVTTALAPSLTNCTFLAIIRSPNDTTPAVRSLLACDNLAGTYWAFGLDAAHKLAFGNSTDGWTDSRSAALDDGAWHFIAVTRQAGAIVSWYIDGASAGTRAAAAGAINPAAPITTSLRVGLANSWYQGQLAELAFFDRLLTQRDIEDLNRSINPALYSFGGAGQHPIESLELIDQPPPHNWVRLQGSGRETESFDPESVGAHGPRLSHYRTLDATTDARATAYAANRLRRDTAEDLAARLTAPWATGPQLFDHIAVTHPALAQQASHYRVNGIHLDYARGPKGHQLTTTYDLTTP